MNSNAATRQNYQDKLKFLRSVSQVPNAPPPKIEARDHSIDTIINKMKKFEEKLQTSIVPNPYVADLNSHAIQTMPELLNYDVSENESIDIEKWKEEIQQINKGTYVDKENTAFTNNIVKSIELRDVNYLKMRIEAMSIKESSLKEKLSSSPVIMSVKIPTITKNSSDTVIDSFKINCPAPNFGKNIIEIKSSSNHRLGITDKNLNSFINSELSIELIHGTCSVAVGKLSIQKVVLCKQFKYDGIIKIYGDSSVDVVPQKQDKKGASPKKTKKNAKPKKELNKDLNEVIKSPPSLIAEVRVLIQLAVDDADLKIESELEKKENSQNEQKNAQEIFMQLQTVQNTVHFEPLNLVLYIHLHSAKEILLRKLEDTQIYRNLYIGYKSPIGLRITTPVSWNTNLPEFSHESQYPLEINTYEATKKYQSILFEFWDRVSENNEELLGISKVGIDKFWNSIFAPQTGNIINASYQNINSSSYPYVLIDGYTPIYSYKLKSNVGQAKITLALGNNEQIFKFKELISLRTTKENPRKSQSINENDLARKSSEKASEEGKEDNQQRKLEEDADTVNVQDQKQFSFMNKEETKQTEEPKPIESLNEIANLASLLNSKPKNDEDADPTPEKNIPMPSVTEKNKNPSQIEEQTENNIEQKPTSSPINEVPESLQEDAKQDIIPKAATMTESKNIQTEENIIPPTPLETITTNEENAKEIAKEDEIVKPPEDVTPIIPIKEPINEQKECNKIRHVISMEIVDLIDIPILNKILVDRYGPDFFSNTQYISYAGLKYSFPFDNKVIETDSLETLPSTLKELKESQKLNSTFKVGLVSKHCCILSINDSIAERLGKEPCKISLFLRNETPCCIGNAHIAYEEIEELLQSNNNAEVMRTLFIYGTPACQRDKSIIGKVRIKLQYTQDRIFSETEAVVEKEVEVNRRLPVIGVLSFKIESLKYFKAPPINSSTLGNSYIVKVSPFYESADLNKSIAPLTTQKHNLISEITKEGCFRFNITLSSDVLEYIQHKKALLEVYSISAEAQTEQLQGKLLIPMFPVLMNPGGSSETYDLVNQYNEIIGELSINMIYQKEEALLQKETQHEIEQEEQAQLNSPIIRVSPFKNLHNQQNEIKEVVEKAYLKICIDEGIRINYYQQLNSFVEIEIPFATLNKPDECNIVFNNTNPKWQYIYDACFDTKAENLDQMLTNPIIIRVYHKSTEKVFIGYAEVDVSNLLLLDNWNCIEGYYHIKPSNSQYAEIDAIGQIRLKIESSINLKAKRENRSCEIRPMEIEEYNNEEINKETVQQLLNTLEEVKEINPFLANFNPEPLISSPEKCPDENVSKLSQQELRQKSMQSIQELQNMALQMSIQKKSPFKKDDIPTQPNEDANNALNNSNINQRETFVEKIPLIEQAIPQKEENKQDNIEDNAPNLEEQMQSSILKKPQEIIEKMQTIAKIEPAEEVKKADDIKFAPMTTPSKRSCSIPDPRRSIDKAQLMDSIKKKNINESKLPPKMRPKLSGQSVNKIMDAKRILGIMMDKTDNKKHKVFDDLSSDSDNE